MAPDLLPAIAALACVARHASFTRAAAELGVSPSALSQTLRKLEARLGVRLLDRTTRRVGVNEIGQRFLRGAESGLASIERAIDDIADLRDRPAGRLRINLSRTAADIVVMPKLAAFVDAHPDIELELHCDNALIDLVSGGFDAGIRVGENLAQDVVGVALSGLQRIATLASPGYLAQRPAPRRPDDLADHRCINIRLGGGLYRWEYSHQGRRFEVEPVARLIVNDGDTVLAAAREGVGIACLFESQVAKDFACGRLVPLLQPWWPEFPGFYLYHTSRSHVPPKLRAFIDFFRLP